MCPYVQGGVSVNWKSLDHGRPLLKSILLDLWHGESQNWPGWNRTNCQKQYRLEIRFTSRLRHQHLRLSKRLYRWIPKENGSLNTFEKHIQLDFIYRYNFSFTYLLYLVQNLSKSSKVKRRIAIEGGCNRSSEKNRNVYNSRSTIWTL